MELNRQETASAEVLLRPAKGRPIGRGTLITAKNLADFRPSAESATSAAATLQAAGFLVGPLVGLGFSITGPVHTFEEYFGRPLQRTEKGGFAFVGPGATTLEELSAAMLPEELREFVHTVTFMPPPDFGPQEFLQ